MELVSIKDKKTGAIKKVKKVLASDYVGTGKFELLKEKKEKQPVFNINKDFSINKEEEK